MKEQKQQYVTIKGTKEGITLVLDDICSYRTVLEELDEKLTSKFCENSERPLIPVYINVGNRYLTKEQDEEIRTLVRMKKNLVVENINCNVMSRAEALEWKRSNEIKSVTKTIRSGQVLKVQGDLLLIGDVNPGGMVVAGGNIYVMGALKGIAHAGYYGNRNAIIAASLMKPMQLRIYDLITRSPDTTESGNEMEYAYVNEEGRIAVDRLQQLTHLKPNITR
ncbi:MAG: septum site-determining protein MinC [Bacillaceae bacterium]